MFNPENRNPENRSIKCVIVGDPCSHINQSIKTQLYRNYVSRTFSIVPDYNLHTGEVTIDNQSVNLMLADTTGHEDYDRLRSLDYSSCDVFILTFSMLHPSSFENIRAKWVPEINRENPGKPIILVGLESDQANDCEVRRELQQQGIEPVSDQQASNLAREIRANKYLNCSLKNPQEAEAVVNAAIMEVLAPAPAQRYDNVVSRLRSLFRR